MIILPVPVITEVTYLLQRDLGIEAVALFLENLSETDFILEVPTAEDYKRAAQDYFNVLSSNFSWVCAAPEAN